MGTIGRVTNSGEPRVSVTVRSGTGAEHGIEALIDTGFNGGLALPPHFIEALDLSLVGRERMLLASGDLHVVRTYRAHVEVEDRGCSARALEAGEPLIGMVLLWGYDLYGIMRMSAGCYSGPGRQNLAGFPSGLEESGARTAVDAERPKSIVPEGATRPSLIDFRALTEGKK